MTTVMWKETLTAFKQVVEQRGGGPMTTPAESTSVRHEVIVEAPIERAFAIFTEEFDRIKPREHNMLSVGIAETPRRFSSRARAATSTTAEDRLTSDGKERLARQLLEVLPDKPLDLRLVQVRAAVELLEGEQ